ncbi:MAG TPA: hypothetical protein VL404_07205 [Candidatus Eisenbacteria bacterium]|jgi:hypothetical protein|nr:hypothetical protein [Candidatus Eisenbacteria bacterium]
MAQAGWDVRTPVNRAFYNVKGILQREELRKMEDTINVRARERVDRSV